jgi:hypothetical protein
MEEWRDIPEFPGYKVSSLGNVEGKFGRLLKLCVGNHGYYRVSLRKENKTYHTMIHTLVALMFIGTRPENYDIDHIDRNRTNNILSNLRYVSRSINCLNSGITSNSGYHNIYSSKNHFMVGIYRKDLRFTKYCKTLEEAIQVRDNHLSKTSLSVPDDTRSP